MNVPSSTFLNPPEAIKPKKKSAPQIILTSNIITTPCEKVLSILQDAKNCIQSNTKGQISLIASLEWAIEIISSRSLYSYEIKEVEQVNKLSQENPEFKALVDFVSEYNEKVIKMSRKYNSITDKLLLKPSVNLNKKKLKRKSSFIKEKPKLLNIFDNQETIKQFRLSLLINLSGVCSYIITVFTQQGHILEDLILHAKNCCCAVCVKFFHIAAGENLQSIRSQENSRSEPSEIFPMPVHILPPSLLICLCPAFAARHLIYKKYDN